MQISRNTSLAPHTTFKIGGPAAYFSEVDTVGELDESIRFSKEQNIPFIVLGGGSNILIDDNGFDGLVIKNRIAGITYEKKEDETFVVVGAGEDWDSFVADTVSRGLYGLENLSGIPGSVGATPIQNVGAYGVEVAQYIEWVELFNTETYEVEKLTNKECSFGYRDSLFKKSEGKKYIVVRVCFKLSKQGTPYLEYKDLKNYFRDKRKPTLDEVREAVLAIRSKKFPDLETYGTAGSFFKNPVLTEHEYKALQHAFPGVPGFVQEDGCIKVSVAWLLDQLQLKGICKSNVCTFQNQPLVIVTERNATAHDVVLFTNEIANIVKQKTNITLQPEVTFIKNKK